MSDAGTSPLCVFFSDFLSHHKTFLSMHQDKTFRFSRATAAGFLLTPRVSFVLQVGRGTFKTDARVPSCDAASESISPWEIFHLGRGEVSREDGRTKTLKLWDKKFLEKLCRGLPRCGCFKTVIWRHCVVVRSQLQVHHSSAVYV